MYRPLLALLLTCLSTLILLAGLTLYGRFVEPHWVEESHWELNCPHWKGRPLRLAVVADLHAKADEGAYLDELVLRVLAAKPDAVLLLGDYMNEKRLGNSMEPGTLGRHLSPLAQLPCFAVFGNHDYQYGLNTLRDMLQGFGAEVIDGKTQAFEVGGDTLYLSGMRCQCAFDTPGSISDQPAAGAKATWLLLCHSPSGAHYAPQGVTATLAAHTHGGQVCLPGGMPILRPDRRVGWEEMQGSFETLGKPVYVTRGLGTSMMPVRLFCRPELLFVEMRGPK